LAYGFEHWGKVGPMANPAGYLYRVGQSEARRAGGVPVGLIEVSGDPVSGVWRHHTGTFCQSLFMP
jgi:hypothetical protein